MMKKTNKRKRDIKRKIKEKIINIRRRRRRRKKMMMIKRETED